MQIPFKQLDQKAYDDLVQKASKLEIVPTPKSTNQKNWYEQTKEMFCKNGEVTEDNFLTKMAFAYSWMPTIPQLPKDWQEHWPTIRDLMEEFAIDSKNFKKKRKLIISLVKIINNSVVGASKALHFFFPLDAPIIDSRVVKTWNQITNDRLSLYKSTQVNSYLIYWDKLTEWASHCTSEISINHIEQVLFKLNGKLS